MKLPSPFFFSANLSLQVAIPHPSSKSPVPGDFESTFPPGEGFTAPTYPPLPKPLEKMFPNFVILRLDPVENLC